jgi:hypothetical protein
MQVLRSRARNLGFDAENLAANLACIKLASETVSGVIVMISAVGQPDLDRGVSDAPTWRELPKNGRKMTRRGCWQSGRAFALRRSALTTGYPMTRDDWLILAGILWFVGLCAAAVYVYFLL